MSSQVNVRSIESLKDLRVALALYGEDTLSALGAIDAEARRTLLWLNQDRPRYWQDQVKRGRERVAEAQAEVFRKKLSQRPGSAPSMTEQVENLKRAEAMLRDAEQRLILTRKWQVQLQQAILEYHGTNRRLKSQAAGEVPRAVNLLSRLIDSLEAYLAVTPPSAATETTDSAPAAFVQIATKMIDDEPPAQETPVDEDPDEPPLEAGPADPE